MLWSFGAVLWNVSCFSRRLFCVGLSTLQAAVERMSGGAVDKWGQGERTPGHVSLFCSQFNINTGWKDCSSLHHPIRAKRHNNISIGQEREKERERESLSVWVSEWAREREDCQDKSESNKTLNFLSLSQVPWRSLRDGKWAAFKSNPIKQ